MKIALIVLAVIIVIAAVGVGAFLTGRNIGLTQAQNIRTEFLQQRTGTAGSSTQGTNGSQTGQRGQAGRAVAAGIVKNVQGNTIQVTQQDGTTTTVTVDNKAVIQKTITGTLSDIQSGMRVTVVDQTTGNETIRRIQLSPAQ